MVTSMSVGSNLQKSTVAGGPQQWLNSQISLRTWNQSIYSLKVAHIPCLKDSHNTASRIDRILFSSEWDVNCSYIKQALLQRLISDHVPIALQRGTWNIQNL